MIREIVHFATLKSKTKKHLSFCLNEAASSEEINSAQIGEIQKDIESGNIGEAVISLVGAGNKLEAAEVVTPAYWESLHWVAISHKMKNEIILLGKKVES